MWWYELLWEERVAKVGRFLSGQLISATFFLASFFFFFKVFQRLLYTVTDVDQIFPKGALKSANQNQHNIQLNKKFNKCNLKTI